MSHRHTLLGLAVFLLHTALIPLFAQCGLQSGPMNGHSDMLEATVWVQTKCTQQVFLRYWAESDTEKADAKQTRVVQTTADRGFTAHLVADQVEPGQKYFYEVVIDREVVQLSYQPFFVTQTLWQHRTDAPDFTFVAGSCTYVNEPAYDRPGRPYGGDYHIFQSILREDPDMMVWLGDNIYLREVDWNSRTGIYHRWTHTRSLPEMQALLGQVHHYATWDDHDYGPNDSDRSFPMKDVTLQAFKDFWANPNYGAGGTEGITGSFMWQDCQFFLMDDRWYRGPKGAHSDYYGRKQLNWLVEALRYSRAPFKFICTGGQVVSDAQVFENYANFSLERKMLLDSIDKYNIRGVVFLTGDRHHSEISRMQTADGDIIYDITSSALTSTSGAHPDEPNSYRIPDSMIGQRNYAVISVSGKYRERTCRVVFKDAFGTELYSHTLR